MQSAAPKRTQNAVDRLQELAQRAVQEPVPEVGPNPKIPERKNCKDVEDLEQEKARDLGTHQIKQV